MNCLSYNLFFETISHKLRMHILSLLKQKDMSVSDICTALKQEQSKISHNLRKMAECHIVDVRKQGKQRIYSLNKETMVPLLKLVENHVERYCKGSCKLGQQNSTQKKSEILSVKNHGRFST